MIRLLLALPLAGLMTAGLFSFMAWVVEKPSNALSSPSSPLMFNMVMTEPEATTQRRQRQLPEPPQLPDQPKPLATQSPKLAAAAQPNRVDTPQIDSANFGVAVSMPTFDGLGQNQQAMPLYRVEPKYPAKALMRNIEGYVILAFTINEQGRPQDIKLIEAKPKRGFVRSAKQALKRWKYQPKMENGKAVIQPGQQVKLEFKINK